MRIGGIHLVRQTVHHKRFWVHLATLVLVAMVFAGCHEPEGAGHDDEQDNRDTDDTNTETPDQYEIGLVMVLSGDAGPLGQSALKGAQLAVSEINDNGGINGAELSLVQGDTKLDPTEATRVFQDVIADGDVQAVIGALASGITQSIVGAAQEAEVVLISPASTRADITDPRPSFFFRNIPSDVIQGTKAASILYNDLEIDSTVVMAQNNAYAIGVQRIFSEEYPTVGGTVTGEPIVFHEDDESTYPGFAQDAVARNPEHIWIAGQYPEIGHMIRELRSAGYEGQIMTTEAIENGQLFDIAGEAVHGVQFTKPYVDLESAAYDEFQQAYSDMHDEEVGSYSAYAYDAVYVIAHAFEAGAVTGEQIRAHMQDATVPGRVTTPTMAFNQNGDVTTGDYVLWEITYENGEGSFSPVA